MHFLFDKIIRCLLLTRLKERGKKNAPWKKETENNVVEKRAMYTLHSRYTVGIHIHVYCTLYRFIISSNVMQVNGNTVGILLHIVIPTFTSLLISPTLYSYVKCRGERG